MHLDPNLPARITEAQSRIGSHVRRTYLERSRVFSELTGANVFFKCENLQHTGSFKLRGAINKFLSLSPQQQGYGVVAASTGNHGKAVAFTADLSIPRQQYLFLRIRNQRKSLASNNSVRAYGWPEPTVWKQNRRPGHLPGITSPNTCHPTMTWMSLRDRARSASRLVNNLNR